MRFSSRHLLLLLGAVLFAASFGATANDFVYRQYVKGLRELTAAPVSQWSVTALNFGAVAVGQTATQTVSLQNIGTATANWSSLSGLQPGFTADMSACASVAPGNACLVTIAFAPTAAQSYAASQLKPADPGTSPANTLDVQGTGAYPQPSWAHSSPLMLGFRPTAQSLVYHLTLTNASSGTVSMHPVTFVGSSPSFYFAGTTGACSTSTSFSLASGASCTVAVGFYSGSATQHTTTVRAATTGGTNLDLVVQAAAVAFGNNAYATFSDSSKYIAWAPGAPTNNGAGLTRTVSSGKYYLEYWSVTDVAPEFCFQPSGGKYFCYRPVYEDIVGSPGVSVSWVGSPLNWQAGDVIGLRIDADTKTMTFVRNRGGTCTTLGVATTTESTIGSYVWRSGSSPTSYSSGAGVNLGQSPWKCPPPDGYVGFGY